MNVFILSAQELNEDCSIIWVSKSIMKETLTKNELLKGLPLSAGEVTVWQWTRQDLDTLAAWPDYPFPYLLMEITSAE